MFNDWFWLNSESGIKFPSNIVHKSLPPFDASDGPPDNNIVHTTPPPELIVPSGRDVMFMRADFNGVNLDSERWGGNPPFLFGANTTPLTMLMTPMLLMYPRKWQDACLTEHAERSYTHFIIDRIPWNPNRDYSISEIKDWCRYIKSWGFYVVMWRCIAELNDIDIAELVSAGLVDWIVVGQEVDSHMTSESYDGLLRDYLKYNLPLGTHFTANYPEGFPRDTFVTNWNEFDGKVHLMWQANQYDSAGRQGAMMYYARQRVNLGLVGGNNIPAPNSRVYAYETMASKQLYGMSEEDGCLRTLEQMYCPADNPGIRMMSGFGNGNRMPNGTYFRT